MTALWYRQTRSDPGYSMSPAAPTAAAGCPRRAVQPPRAQPRAAQPSHPPGPRGSPHVLARPAAGWRSSPAPLTSPPATSCCTGWARATRSRSSTSRRSRCAASRSRWSSRPRWRSRSAACSASRARATPPTSRRRWQPTPSVLVVAPLSGHHATLLRDTVRTLLGDHNVYITDWIDARHGAGRPRGVHARRLRRLPARVHPPHRRRAAAHRFDLPGRRAGAGGGRADRGRRRAPAAQPGHDGRPHRHAPQPDPGQRVRHQQAR